MSATKAQQGAVRDVRYWGRIYLVTGTLWIGVVIANLFVHSPVLWNVGVGFAILTLIARCAQLSARIDLANANIDALAEFVDGRR